MQTPPERCEVARLCRGIQYRQLQPQPGRVLRLDSSLGASSRILGLLWPNQPLRRAENPRVDGSIPSLATISNSMN